MTAPAGCLSLAQEYLRATLAASAAWQSECNADDADAAKERIYHHGLPAPASGEAHTKQELMAYRPYAIVFTAEARGFTRTFEAGGDEFEFDQHGRLTLRLYRNSPDDSADEPTAAANLTWHNLVGEIIDQMCELAGGAGYLAFQTIGVLEGPYWSHPKVTETEGIWQGVDVLVEW